MGLVRSGPTLTTAAAKLAELATRPDVEYEGKTEGKEGTKGSGLSTAPQMPN